MEPGQCFLELGMVDGWPFFLFLRPQAFFSWIDGNSSLLFFLAFKRQPTLAKFALSIQFLALLSKEGRIWVPFFWFKGAQESDPLVSESPSSFLREWTWCALPLFVLLVGAMNAGGAPSPVKPEMVG